MAMSTTETTQAILPLPLRPHTIFGVCEGLGEDFGFNPTYLRVALAAMVLWHPSWAFAAYALLGGIVVVSRLAFPDKVIEPATSAEIETVEADEPVAGDDLQLAA